MTNQNNGNGDKKSMSSMDEAKLHDTSGMGSKTTHEGGNKSEHSSKEAQQSTKKGG